MRAAGKSQKMQAIQCNDPFRSKYNKVNMKGKQSVAVDLYDEKTTNVLMSILHVFCNKDDVSLITFGNHIHRIQLEIDHNEWNTMNCVSKELSRICTRVAPPYKSDFMKPCAMVE